jgi:hypothetical protein
MANGDDGYSEIGGGGSVNWKVEVNDGNVVETRAKDIAPGVPWGYVASDTDDVGNRNLDGRYFKVAIRGPIQWRRQGKQGAVLYIPITDDPRQIRVSWAHALTRAEKSGLDNL